MRKIEGKLSKIEKVIKQKTESEDVRTFLARFDFPENDDLLNLAIEGIIIRGLTKSDALPMKHWTEFWDKLKAYCDQKEVEVLHHESANAVANAVIKGKISRNAIKYKKSKPSRPLNFHVIVRSLSLEKEED